MRWKILRAFLDGVDDHREPRAGEDDVGRGLGRVGGAGHGDSHVGLFQGRGVVDAVAGHAHDVALVLEEFHDVILVLREDLGEAVGLLHHLLGLPVGLVQERGHGLNVGAQVHLAGDLLGDGHVVAGDHLDIHPHVLSGLDGVRRILPGRIVQGQEADEPPGRLRRRSWPLPACGSPGPPGDSPFPPPGSGWLPCPPPGPG